MDSLPRPERATQGLIQVYTGEGKGKTTAALGLALRAAGQGMRVLIVQFVKGRPSGEHHFVAQHHPFELVQFNQGDSLSQPREVLAKACQDSLDYARQALASSKYDIVILDEVLMALHLGLIRLEEVLALIEARPTATELLLTGRYAPAQVIERADLVTEMRAIKHPFQKGVAARLGIEY